MKKEQDNVLYQKSQMRHARGMYDQARYRGWQPEHERLNVDPHPVQDFSDDFRFAKRPNPARPVPGGHSAASRHTSGSPMRQMRQMRLSPQPVNVTGMNHENAWMEGQVPDEFEFDMVPDPPPSPFTHVMSGPRAPNVRNNAVPEPPLHLREEHSEEVIQPLHKVHDGEYCVFVSGNLLFSTPSLEEAEDALNRLIFSDNPVPVEDVVVMRRLNLKIGASIG
jgi:hypothetical protein